jgi:peptidyl-prolyl cis-trans isomerase B (cyclophilin B)
MNPLKNPWLISLLLCLFVSSGVLVGCSGSQTTASNATTEQNIETIPSPPAIASSKDLTMDNYKPRLDGTATVEMIINGSPVIIEVDGKDAPITAGNFVDLVSQGFYDGLIFHRVVKAPQPFVAQGGDPQGKGTGGFIDPKTKQERRIPLEIKVKDQPTPTYNKVLGQQGGYNSVSVTLSHKRGAIAMARSQAPDSASSQFYFALSDLDFLDGDYAVFGYVTQGMETVDGIKQGDRITSAKVIKGAENLKK